MVQPAVSEEEANMEVNTTNHSNIASTNRHNNEAAAVEVVEEEEENQELEDDLEDLDF